MESYPSDFVQKMQATISPDQEQVSQLRLVVHEQIIGRDKVSHSIL